MKKRDPKKFLESIKEKVDFIYDLTSKDAPYSGTFKKFNDRLLDEVLAEVIRSGALIKVPHYGGGRVGRTYTFQWNANAPAPTAVFYKNIAKAVAALHDDKVERWRIAKRAQREREKESALQEQVEASITKYNIPEKEEVPAPKVEKEVVYVYIKDYSDQQLWEELKDRGYQIEDGRLVKKEYLD